MNPTTEELLLLALKQVAANQRLIINRLFNRDEAVALALSNTDKLCEAIDNGIRLIPRPGIQKC
jgi:hypothetical protein